MSKDGQQIEQKVLDHPDYKRLCKLGVPVFTQCGVRLTFHKLLPNCQDWIFWNCEPDQTQLDLVKEFVRWLDQLSIDGMHRDVAVRWREVSPKPSLIIGNMITAQLSDKQPIEQSLLYKLLSEVGPIEYKAPTEKRRGVIKLLGSSIKSWNFKSKEDAVRQLARMLVDGIVVNDYRLESTTGKAFREVLERFVAENTKAQPLVQREVLEPSKVPTLSNLNDLYGHILEAFKQTSNQSLGDGYQYSIDNRCTSEHSNDWSTAVFSWMDAIINHPEYSKQWQQYMEQSRVDIETLAKYKKQQELYERLQTRIEQIYKLNDPNDEKWIVLHHHAAITAIELEDITGAEIIVGNALATTNPKFSDRLIELENLIPSMVGV